MWAGQKFRFKTDPKGDKGDIFTIKAVSAFVNMIEIAEFGLWCYTDNIVVIEEEPYWFFEEDKIQN